MFSGTFLIPWRTIFLQLIYRKNIHTPGLFFQNLYIQNLIVSENKSLLIFFQTQFFQKNIYFHDQKKGLTFF